MSLACVMYLVPYNATNDAVRHVFHPAVLVPAYRHSSVMPVTCVAPSSHCSGSGGRGDRDKAHTSVDKYDRWCEQMQAGEFDPKPGEPGYPVRCTGVFLLRSENNKEIWVFCMKELHGNRVCSVERIYDKHHTWTDVTELDLMITHRTNRNIELLFQNFNDINVSAEMNKKFQEWITSNGFVCNSYKVHEGSDDDSYGKSEEVMYELPQTFALVHQQNVYTRCREKMREVTYELPQTLTGKDEGDKYDRWCEKMQAGEFDPKPAEKNYPARCVSAFVLRSVNNNQRFCFCITEKYGQRKCFGRDYLWKRVNTLDIEMETLKNGQKNLNIDKLGEIIISKDMMASFEAWIQSNDFRCIRHKRYTGEEQDGSEEFEYKLSETLPGTDLYDVWKAKVTQGVYSNKTCPFLLRGVRPDGEKTFRFCIYREEQSSESFCVWTAKPEIHTEQWHKQRKLDVLYEKDPKHNNIWEIFIFFQGHARVMLINEQMKTEFDAWLAECAKDRTPKTDPVYYNARGYSYTF